jgi:hypothetical protein
VRIAVAIGDMERDSNRKTCMGDGMDPDSTEGSAEKNNDKAAVTTPPTPDQNDTTPGAD